MTDLAHVAHLLHEVAHRERFSLPALRDWLRRQRDERSGPTERNRRLDSDAKAVQIMTVWGSKGLQFPIVYLPFAFNRYVWSTTSRCITTTPTSDACTSAARTAPTVPRSSEFSRIEAARNDIRLTYVALTRAESQVVAWWAPAADERNGGLSRLMRGRKAGEAEVPDRCEPADGLRRRGARVLPGVGARRRPGDRGGVDRRGSDTAAADAVVGSRCAALPSGHRHDVAADVVLGVDPRRRDARGGQRTGGHRTRRRSRRRAGGRGAAGAGVPSPMADLPTGAKFGTLVHAVLETADPLAEDLRRRVGGAGRRAQRVVAGRRPGSRSWPRRWCRCTTLPLGPLADGLTLRQIGLKDRLREMDFEFPLAGGDLRDAAPDIRLADVGRAGAVASAD